MRILIVSDSVGLHVVLLNWINDLTKLGHEVKLATPTFNDKRSSLFYNFKINRIRKLYIQTINIKNIILPRKVFDII